jgi:hypothetical protein
MDPVPLRQSSDLFLGNITRVLVVDLLDCRPEFETSLANQSFLFALLTAETLLVDQQGQSVNEGEALIGTDLLQLGL